MLDLPRNISEAEIRQVFCDQQTRMETGSASSQKMVSIQKLIAKIHCLSDLEFDVAFRAFEAIIENAHTKKQNSVEVKQKETPEKMLENALRSVNKIQKKT